MRQARCDYINPKGTQNNILCYCGYRYLWDEYTCVGVINTRFTIGEGGSKKGREKGTELWLCSI